MLGGWFRKTHNVWITVCAISIFAQEVYAEGISEEQTVSSQLEAESEAIGAFESLSLVDLLNMEVSSAGFFANTARTAPNYTFVISRQALAAGSARTIKEMIDTFVPGMQMTEHFWTGALIGARGVSVDNNAKTLVLINSAPLNMRRHFGANKELNLPLVGDLQRVEVIQGPNALVHGGGAINGVINLITKRGKDYKGVSVRAEYGAQESAKLGEASYGLVYGEDKDLFVYMGAVQADGFTPDGLSWSSAALASVEAAGQSVQAREIEPSFKGTINWNHGDLSFNATMMRIFDSTNAATATGWLAAGGPPRDLGWYRGVLSFGPSYNLKLNDSNSVTASFLTQFHDFGYFYKETADTERDIMGGGKESYNRGQVLWRNTSIPSNSLALGFWVGYRNIVDGETFFAGTPNQAFESGQIDWWDLSVFMEDVWEITDTLTMSAGFRLGTTILGEMTVGDILGQPENPDPNRENVTVTTAPPTDTTNFSPRIALAFVPTDNDTIKLSYGRGFRLPDSAYFGRQIANNELFNRGISQEGGGADGLGTRRIELQPETMDSLEFNYTRTMFDKHLVVNSSLYANNYSNLIAWGGFAFINVPDDFWSVGGELSVDSEIPINVSIFDRLNFSTVYGYSQPLGFGARAFDILPSLVNGTQRGDSHDQWVAYSPHQFKFNSTLLMLDNMLALSGSARVFSAVQTAGDPNDPTDDQSVAGEAFGDAVVLVDASINVMTKYVRVKGTIQNITGNEVPTTGSLNNIAGGVPDNGQLGINARTYYVSLEGRF